MKVYLKVKIKSLAAEAHIIRREERRTRGDLRYALQQHRKTDVRQEARAAILAYGFLRGRDFRAMEAKGSKAPYWSRIEALVKKYGEDDLRERMQRFAEWKDAAEGA